MDEDNIVGEESSMRVGVNVDLSVTVVTEPRKISYRGTIGPVLNNKAAGRTTL